MRPRGNIDFTDVQLQMLTGARPTSWTQWTGTTNPSCGWTVASSEFDAKLSWTP